ncbi:hypothetical protein BHE74_00009811 [Ensete ventricosum]|nr:hypothetical protein BHE74_00009811 [Ensete ventricosum]
MVSWCHSFRWYRSAKAPYQSASSGCAFRWDSRYWSAPAIDGSVDLFRREKSTRPRKKSRSPNSTLIASFFFLRFFFRLYFLTLPRCRGGGSEEGGLAQISHFSGEAKTLVIGLAADSACGKSTFMRRLTSVFGDAAAPPEGGNPDSNTLIGDTATVICLDDYRSLDRSGRKKKGEEIWCKVGTASRASKLALKLESPTLMLTLVLNFAVENIQESAKEHFNSYHVYCGWQIRRSNTLVLPSEFCQTQLIADDSEGKVLCVRLIMKEGVEVLQSSLPFRRRIHHLVDTMREEAGTLVPWHRGLLWPRHLLLRRGDDLQYVVC